MDSLRSFRSELTTRADRLALLGRLISEGIKDISLANNDKRDIVQRAKKLQILAERRMYDGKPKGPCEQKPAEGSRHVGFGNCAARSFRAWSYNVEPRPIARPCTRSAAEVPPTIGTKDSIIRSPEGFFIFVLSIAYGAFLFNLFLRSTAGRAMSRSGWILATSGA